jgi:NAD(P)-dependent dehydrogenase (short-subunit alcohol dehydrogenase family)
MESFDKRVVLITGAASGIGRQLALTLAAEGAHIAALDRHAERLDGLAAELKGHTAACAVADVTDLPAVRAAVGRLEAQLSPVDLLIASAGIGIETPAIAFRGEDFAAQVQVNLIGVANVLDAILPGMRRRRRGHLAALSSVASYRGLPFMSGYCASKAGLNSLFDALRVELRPLGIAVSTICPGWVRTPMTDPLHLPEADMMNVEEAVRLIVQGLRRRQPFIAFPSGTVWRARLLRHTPQAFSDWLTRRWASKMKK